ncbi:MAG: hypothetical protein MJ086_03540 [Lachnospiraceae bacterium]|nr:hypothetical protein [Lachnospiraceae bacterium]
MGIDKIENLAKVLKTTPAYLMGWKEDDSLQSLTNDLKWKYADKDGKLQEILINVNKLNDTGLNHLENYLQFLRGKNTEYNNMDALPNWADQIKPVEIRTLPVLGRVACGKPIFTEEEREYVTIEDAPKNVDFILIAKGDSMINARINDGDYVFIRKQSEVNNGDIAVVIIDDEATLKRVHFDKEKQILQLLPENPAYMPLVFVGDELENVQILGKAIAVMSMLK